MRPIRTLFALLFFGLLPASTFAVEIVVRGPIARVDPVGGTVTLATQPNPRTIAVDPAAVVTVNGARVTLEQLPMGGEAFLVAEKDLSGRLHATQITASHDGPAFAAAYPPGSLIAGIVMGIDAGAGIMIVRTAIGDQRVPLGSAPVVLAGRRVPLTQLAVGDAVRIHRVLPPGGTERITDTIWVTSAERVAGYRSTIPAAPTAGVAHPAPPTPPTARSGAPSGGTSIRIREVPVQPTTKPAPARR
jgi:hypothetical protein